MNNKVDKSRHLACIHYDNQNTLVYGCRDITIIWIQPYSKRHSVPIPSIKSAKKFLNQCLFSKAKWKENQIMKLKAFADVHFVYMTSFTF